MAAIRRSSGSQRVGLNLDAKIAGESVDLSAEGGKSGWSFQWHWDLKERDLDDVASQLFPSLGDGYLPEGIGKIKLHSIDAEVFSAESCKGLSFGIADLSVLYVTGKDQKVKDQAGKSGAAKNSLTCWGLAHEKPIPIPTSGVVAMLLGKDLILSDLRVGSVSGFTPELRNQVIGLLPQARLLLGTGVEPPTGLVAGITITGIGDKPIEVPFVDRKREQRPGGPPQEVAAPAAAAVSVDSADGTRKWFVVNKTVGPLRLGRVGCEFKDSKIGLLLDATVDVGGLHFGLSGLSARLPPSDPKPANLELSLDGIDLSYRGGPIGISGSFLRSEVTVDDQKTTQYDGMAVIQAANFTITGIGSYASVEGKASLFIFAILHMELGGPPCFRVNGLAAGFGYNRRLILPPIEEVSSFPLVRAALDANYFGSGSTESNSPAGKSMQGPDRSIQAAMGKLHKFIPASLGDYWFAIGVRFSSFEMIEAFALLSVSFGKDVEIGLLGLAAATIPKGAEPGKAIAYAELALRASIKPAEGTIQVEARLTNESYIFYKDCHLTGGFAFYIWFGGPLAGDFVVTLGGYHPRFLRPAHYPTVPRLGINWEVTKELTITAGMYFALTPSCLMAGGKLSAIYQSRSVKVWFIVYADFLLSWQPFYYAIDAGIALGVEVDLGIFVLRIHLGAEVHLWGPEFAGIVIVDIIIFTITIHFGGPKKAPPPLTTEEFVDSFLSKPEAVIAIQINSGLIREQKIEGEENDTATVLRVVNAHEFSLTTQSLIPVSDFTDELRPEDDEGFCSNALGIRSMGKTSLTSTYSVTIHRIKNDSPEVVDREPGASLEAIDRKSRPSLRASLVKSRVPDALWGQSAVEGEAPLPDSPEAITLEARAGIRISFDPIHPQGALPAMEIKKFAYEDSDEKPIPWDEGLKPPSGSLSATESKGPETVMCSYTIEKRNAVLSVLAAASPFALNEVDLTGLVEGGGSYFQANPEIRRVGAAFSR